MRWPSGTTAVFGLLLCLVAAHGGRAMAVKAAWVTPLRDPMRVVRRGESVTVTVAPAVLRAVSRHFPTFGVVRLGDYAPFIERGVHDGLDKLSLSSGLFACVGDFDGNGLPDLALLLKDRRSNLLLAAFHQSHNGEFHSHLVDQWSLRQLRNHEWITDDGKLVCWIRRAKGPLAGVRHPFDGIEIVDPGEWTEFFFYYRHGRYKHKFLTPDA